MPTRRVGECHICGTVGPLSFEHVPPKRAFNDKRVIKARFEDIVGIGPDEPIVGENQQRGMGDYTLCPNCNNNTGSWYSSEFIEWCYQGFNILIRARGKPTLIYLYRLLPLRIIKQIVVMFFSVNGPEFRCAHPELVHFVLNKEDKNLPPNYRFYTYYTISSRLRCSGVTGLVNVNTKEVFVFSELSYFPFGYIMTFNSRPPDPRLLDITHFAQYGYNEFAIKTISMPALPAHTWFPADFRTREEIMKQSRENNH